MWLAGGGVRGGVSHGQSDDFGMDVVGKWCARARHECNHSAFTRNRPREADVIDTRAANFGSPMCTAASPRKRYSCKAVTIRRRSRRTFGGAGMYRFVMFAILVSILSATAECVPQNRRIFFTSLRMISATVTSVVLEAKSTLRCWIELWQPMRRPTDTVLQHWTLLLPFESGHPHRAISAPSRAGAYDDQ